MSLHLPTIGNIAQDQTTQLIFHHQDQHQWNFPLVSYGNVHQTAWLWRTTDESDIRPPDLENVIQCNRYSSLSHLHSVTVHVLKFVQALKQAIEQHDTDRSSSSILYLTDSSQAEFMWVQEAQWHLVKDCDFQTWTKQLGLYQDKKGVWMYGGWLQYANVSPSAKHPIILPRKHHLKELVVRDTHSKVFHNGTKETLAQVRSRF